MWGARMRKVGSAFFAIMLGGCAAVTITDRYGNQYGDWYNPGENYRWQLDLCDNEINKSEIPPGLRKLAMRCCMHAHGVPISDPQDCLA